MNFEIFDPEIGVQGYCDAIRKSLYPDETSDSIDVADLELTTRIYPRGSTFSRVRQVALPDIEAFYNGKVLLREFLPPKANVARTSAGRFNNDGERKLYLADHPYVALAECNIKPGDHFLYSYFSFKADTFFIEAQVQRSKSKDIFNSLFRTEDRNFYEVINHVYQKYLRYEGFQGVVYESVRVKKNSQVDFWEEINSITNLAMNEEDLSSANFVGGWLARCDENYRPVFLRSFYPALNPKKQNKLITIKPQEKPKFKAEYLRVINEVKRLSEAAKLRLSNREYIEPPSILLKINHKV